jgi:hypothetical protein
VRWRATISVIVAAVMIAALRRAGRAAQVDPITSMRVENQHSTDR